MRSLIILLTLCGSVNAATITLDSTATFPEETKIRVGDAIDIGVNMVEVETDIAELFLQIESRVFRPLRATIDLPLRVPNEEIVDIVITKYLETPTSGTGTMYFDINGVHAVTQTSHMPEPISAVLFAIGNIALSLYRIRI